MSVKGGGFQKSSKASDEIPSSSLADIAFLLLIFFLVATTFQQTEREMKIALPASSTAGPISTALRELIVNVDEQGQIIVSGTTVTPDDLKSIIESAVARYMSTPKMR